MLLATGLTTAAPANDPAAPLRARQLKFRAPSGWSELRHVVPDTLRVVSYRHPQQAALLLVGHWVAPHPIAPEPAVHRLLRHAGLVPTAAPSVVPTGPATALVTGFGRYRGAVAYYEAMVQAPATEPTVVHLFLSTTPWAQAESPLRYLLPNWSPQPLPLP
ncbi:hypothetical protein [Hymenobacter koreensis]|uniref:Secreted protein n=1 Tax=Hymenobacter koreensis TaxID=1084523 RepID=A0ABP8J926_9BACT